MPPPLTEKVSFRSIGVLRRFLKPLVVSIIILIPIMALLFMQDLEHRRITLQQEGQFAVALQQEFAQLEFEAVQADLLYLAQQLALKQYLSGDQDSKKTLQQDFQKLAESKAIYDQIRVLDEAGKEVIRVNYNDGGATIVPEDELQTKATRYYYQAAMKLDEGEIFVSPFDLNQEHGEIEQPIKPVIRFLTPVFDKSGERRGLLVLNYLGAHLLSKLKEITTGFVGDVMLVNLDGEYLQAPNPDDEWGWMVGHDASFRQQYPAAWRRIRENANEQFRIGRGSFAFREITPSMRLSSKDGLDSETVGTASENSLLLIAHVPLSVASTASRSVLRPLIIMSGVALAVAAVLSLYWARSAVVRERQEAWLADSESRLRRLSSQLLAAQEVERRSISRDLHDELGQQVTAISLELKLAARKNNDPWTTESLERAISETEHLLTSLHQIAARLRPSVLDDLGLRDALGSYISEYEQRTGIVVHSSMRFASEDIPPTVGENVYRIVQESLSNVANHAQTEEVWVRIESEADCLRMTLRDEGVGFDPVGLQDSPRLGMLGMRERVELLNGQFRLSAAPGAGVEIEISIPFDLQPTVHS